jgi:class 3 adenylate cyclase
MKNIGEYTASTSFFELFAHLCDKVVGGELETFSQLKAYVLSLPDNATTRAAVLKAFELQRRLYWGMFKEVAPDSFPRLWDRLVEPDLRYRGAGDLKRQMSIPDVYLGLVDIHGYTRFCHANRHNASMLESLDEMLQSFIPKAAAAAGALCKRVRGDEIILIGASASEVLDAVLRLVDYLSSGGRGAGRDGPGPLPVFQISAGLAGGQKYSSLSITRGGDISGDIVNAAARLQSMANKISPDRNRVLVTNNIVQKVKSRGVASVSEGLIPFDFFNAGKVEFKGLSLSVYDLVFLPAQSDRLAYRECMEELFAAIEQGAWKGKVFEVALKLAARVATSRQVARFMPAPAGKDCQASTEGILELVRTAQGHFAAERFERAVECLGRIVEDLDLMEDCDDLAVEYLEQVARNYAELIDRYAERLDLELEKQLDTLFPQSDREKYRVLQANHAAFAKVQAAARLRANGRKVIWQRAADDAAPSLAVRIKSKK